MDCRYAVLETFKVAANQIASSIDSMNSLNICNLKGSVMLGGTRSRCMKNAKITWESSSSKQLPHVTKLLLSKKNLLVILLMLECSRLLIGILMKMKLLGAV